MKVTVYSCRSFDEKELFEAYGMNDNEMKEDEIKEINN